MQWIPTGDISKRGRLEKTRVRSFQEELERVDLTCSVTSVLLELGLSSFDTVIHNYRFCFRSQWRQHSNSLIGVVRGVCHDAFS